MIWIVCDFVSVPLSCPRFCIVFFIYFSYEEAFDLGVEMSMKYLQESRRKI